MTRDTKRLAIAFRLARRATGYSRNAIATKMGVPDEIWFQYERGTRPIPHCVLIKLLMFGMDFYLHRAKVEPV